MRTAIHSQRPKRRAASGLIDLPVPPLSLPTAENAYRVGEAVLVTLKDGRRVKGALLAFRPDQERMFVRIYSQTAIDAQQISFKEIRAVHVLRDRSVARLSPTLEVRGKVVLPPTRQEFEVILDNDERLVGQTLGFRIDHCGLHLYPADELLMYTHIFVAAHAIKMQRVGPLLGNALVDEKLVTYEALAAELKAQHRLRELPLGEYLISAHVLTARELEEALERQRTMPEMRIGEILIREGLITEAQLDKALAQQEKNRKRPLGEMLVSSGLVTVQTVTQTLAKKLGIPFVDLQRFVVDLRAVWLLSEDVARERQVIPLYVEDGRMVVAMENPLQWELIEALRMLVNMEVEAVMATQLDIAWAIDRYYGNKRSEGL